MPKLMFSQRFARDLAEITSPKLERRIFDMLDYIEAYGGFGSSNVPASVKRCYGEEVRKVAINPFDLIYTLDSEADVAHIEALIHQRSAW